MRHVQLGKRPQGNAEMCIVELKSSGYLKSPPTYLGRVLSCKMRHVQLGKRPQGNAEMCIVELKSSGYLKKPSHLPREGFKLKLIIIEKHQLKAYPLPHGVSPVSVPLIAMQQGIHGKPKSGDTLGLAVGSFS